MNLYYVDEDELAMDCTAWSSSCVMTPVQIAALRVELESLMQVKWLTSEGSEPK